MLNKYGLRQLTVIALLVCSFEGGSAVAQIARPDSATNPPRIDGPVAVGMVNLPCCKSAEDKPSVSLATGTVKWQVQKPGSSPTSPPFPPVPADELTQAVGWFPQIPASGGQSAPKWIGPFPESYNTAKGAPIGTYSYSVKFSSSSCSATSGVRLTGMISADDFAVLKVNGTPVPGPMPAPTGAPPPYSGQGLWGGNSMALVPVNYLIPAQALQPVNTISIDVYNSIGATGLQTDLKITRECDAVITIPEDPISGISPCCPPWAETSIAPSLKPIFSNAGANYSMLYQGGASLNNQMEAYINFLKATNPSITTLSVTWQVLNLGTGVNPASSGPPAAPSQTLVWTAGGTNLPTGTGFWTGTPFAPNTWYGFKTTTTRDGPSDGPYFPKECSENSWVFNWKSQTKTFQAMGSDRRLVEAKTFEELVQKMMPRG
jgi:hypothetical protein